MCPSPTSLKTYHGSNSKCVFFSCVVFIPKRNNDSAVKNRERDRGEARLEREKEHLRQGEDRVRREEENKRHSQFLEMMMLMLAKQGNGSS